MKTLQNRGIWNLIELPMDPTEKEHTKKGVVFNIQRFSIHDGPGIRTTVFMKGCPMNCLWCSNPESQDASPNLMVRDMNCGGCGACLEVCPEGAISLTEKAGRKIKWKECTQCLQCVDACLYNALRACGTRMTIGEILEEVLRDRDFYRNSGGGITVSGGEALTQSEFVAHLLKGCKGKGLHTALDTSGYAPWEKLEKVLSFVDLILWDIKHLDPPVHKRMTGVENRLILENLVNASRTKPVWLRMPLIAGLNDSETYMDAFIDLAKKVGAEKISLLPYHEGGKSKTDQMGRPYPFPQGMAPGVEHIEFLKDLIQRAGIKASIGS